MPVCCAAPSRTLGALGHRAVIKLPHADSFETESPLTHKNAANGDGFGLPAFLKMLLGFALRAPATAMETCGRAGALSVQ
jgi:hypothetical protein